jgi:hypothetical protein
MYRREKLLRLDLMPLKHVAYRAGNFINTNAISIKLDVERKQEKYSQ